MTSLVSSAIFLSFVFFGLMRTALWLLPLIFVEWYLPLASAAWVSFFCALAFLAPYHDGAFDLRGKEKAFWIIQFFLTGLLAGLLVHHVPYWVYALASLIAFAAFQIFRAFRLAVSPIAVFPQWIRILPIIVYFSLFALKRLTGHF